MNGVRDMSNHVSEAFSTLYNVRMMYYYRISSNRSRPRIEAAVGGAMFARNRNRPLILAAHKHGRSVEFSKAIKEAKLVAGTNE